MSRGAPPWHSALLTSAALHRLANFKPLELRVIQIQWLVVSCPTMCCTESFRFSPCFKDGTVFPHRVGSIKCLILSFRALEKVKLHEAWHLLEVTVPRHPNVLERCFGTLGDAKAVHGDKHNWPPISTALSNQINRSSARGARGVSQDGLSFLLDSRTPRSAPDPIQQHVYGFVVRVLRQKLAAERFCEDGLIEMIDQFAGASGF